MKPVGCSMLLVLTHSLVTSKLPLMLRQKCNFQNH